MKKTKKNYDESLINAFLSSYKPSVIQKKAGISKTKYYSLIRDPEFMAVVNERRDLLVKEAVMKMEGYFNKNVETLQEIIDDPETKGQTRVQALHLFMNQLAGWKGITDFMKRVEALESQKKPKKTGKR